MDVFDKFFRRSRVAVILMGIAMLVLGFAMFMSPLGATLLIVQVVGWTLIILGVLTFINAWMHHTTELQQADVILGIIELVFGILMVVSPAAFVAVIFTLLGIFILITGINDISEANYMHRLGLPGRGWRLALGILTCLAGVFVIISPFALAEFVMLFSGLALIFDGITEITAGVTMKKHTV